jgi:uncharacterized membrane protein YhaH (DUF805 family)
MNELIQNYTAVLRNYANFSGRARRREYWMFFLANILVGIVLGILTVVLGRLGTGLTYLYQLAIIIPSIAVGVRRLHDTGRPGWWMLVGLVPLIGFLVLIYFFVQDGQPGTNEYGPNPKENAFAYAV